MNTLRDLLNLITEEIILSQDRLIQYEFRVDTRFNYVDFNKVSPKVVGDEVSTTEVSRESILRTSRIDTPQQIVTGKPSIYFKLVLDKPILI